eukprot:scaffold359638_cov19-Prasinocladus_malaysianus.AAC.1
MFYFRGTIDDPYKIASASSLSSDLFTFIRTVWLQVAICNYLQPGKPAVNPFLRVHTGTILYQASRERRPILPGSLHASTREVRYG